MKLPYVNKYIIPHKIIDGALVFSKGSNLFVATDFSDRTTYKRLPINKSSIVTSVPISILRRILRLGIHLVEDFNGCLLVVRKGSIESFDDRGRLLSIFTGFKGSRPLKFCLGPNIILFGEYFSNSTRESVKIYGSQDGIVWEEMYAFEKGKIRHIHGIQYDKYRDGYWILTGDENSECGLWFTADNFRSVELFYGGSQRSRAVSVHIMEEQIIIPMDSPLEINYILSLSIKGRKVRELEQLPGSAFHCSTVNEIKFITTVTEHSDINKTKNASIYASLDGLNWKCISKLKKDWIPVKFQKITRYSEIKILDGLYKKDFVIAIGRSLDLVSEGLLCWRYDDILKELELS
jgi:hypothetical protein